MNLASLASPEITEPTVCRVMPVPRVQLVSLDLKENREPKENKEILALTEKMEPQELRDLPETREPQEMMVTRDPREKKDLMVSKQSVLFDFFHLSRSKQYLIIYNECCKLCYKLKAC